MVLVLNHDVLARLRRFALTAAAPCVAACGGSGDATSTTMAHSTGNVEAGCHASATERPTRDTDAPRWMQDYGEADVTSISSDGQGNWLVAVAGAETRKVDRDGGLLWSVPYGQLVASDGAGGVYVATATEVVKLDASGTVLYRSPLKAEQGARLQSLSVDVLGNAAVSGPGIGTLKLDPSGSELLRRDFVGYVALAPTGELWLTGALEGSRDFDGITVRSRGGQDVLVLTLDESGTVTHAASFGDAGSEQRGESIHVDADGNVLLAGVFDGSLSFDGGATALAPSRCASDAWCKTSGFAVKFGAEGTTSWSRALGALRAVRVARWGADGSAVLSGALPGGVSTFESSWLQALSATGEPSWRLAEGPETGVGSGRDVAFGLCGELLWAVTAQPELRAAEHSYLINFVP